MVDESAPSVR